MYPIRMQTKHIYSHTYNIQIQVGIDTDMYDGRLKEKLPNSINKFLEEGETV